jgi:integrase
MTRRVVLTDKKLLKLKPPTSGARDVLDALMPALRVRITKSGHKTWVFYTRFPGSPHPSRRALGLVGAMSVSAARNKARAWHELLGKGINPIEAAEQERLAALRSREDNFLSMCEAYFAHCRRQGLRNAAKIEREIRNEFVSCWAARPIADISQHDVAAVVTAAVRRGSPGQAHMLFERIRTLFAWALGTGAYGLTGNPCAALRPTALIGRKTHRIRTLNDDEILAFWRATGRDGYPWQPLYRLLLLTGVRLSEASEARWDEFDLKAKLWTIPAERAKGAAPQIVPLAPDALALLDELPRFNSGDHLFSATFGKTPVQNFSKPKLRLDERMLHTLRALARRRGDDPEKVKLEPWRQHDLRRTLRTQLSKLKVPSEVAEKVLGHDLRGIERVYNQNAFINEMNAALTRWEGRLRSIVEPPSDDNVTPLRAGA